MNKPLSPRPCGKRELARMYFPKTSNAASAVANLRNLMLCSRDLMEELKAAGYKTHAKILTPRQVGIIYRYLGEP